MFPGLQPQTSNTRTPSIHIRRRHRPRRSRRPRRQRRRRRELLCGQFRPLRRRNIRQQRLEGTGRGVEPHRGWQDWRCTPVVRWRRRKVAGEHVRWVAEAEGVEGFTQAEGEVEGVGK